MRIPEITSREQSMFPPWTSSTDEDAGPAKRRWTQLRRQLRPKSARRTKHRPQPSSTDHASRKGARWHPGLLLDFKELKRLLRPFVEYLNHNMINELEPFTVLNPSAG